MQYSEKILEVHHAFENAGDRLLEEAKNYLESNPVPKKEKADLLRKLGFKKTTEAVTASEVESRRSAHEEKMRLVEYYRMSYTQKFITEDDVKAICEKYGLVCGSVGDYIGFVPENNLTEINSFKLKEKDYPLFFMYGYYWLTFKVKRILPELKICAPVKDFDMEDKKIKGYKIENIPVPDPVVLQEVKGGYLIVTAWGDEASDDIIVNEINN